jgi:hypothetical protein
MTLNGGCHCGRLAVEFSTSVPPDQLPLRACQCSFCRRHGARTTSDPAGQIRLTVRGASAPTWYRFGTRATEMWVCPSCGVYVGGGVETAGRAYAVVNVNALDHAESFRQSATPVDYSGETAEGRLARRIRMWTPAEVSVGGAR